MVSAFNPAALAFIAEYLRQYPEPILVHFTLKGSKIWSREDPRIYFDGEAFGVAPERNIGLRFPSGGGLRASDFEMVLHFAANSNVSIVTRSSNRISTTL